MACALDLPPGICRVCWSQRPLGLQTGSLIRQVCTANDASFVDCLACYAGGPDNRSDARRVSMLRSRCNSECLFWIPNSQWLRGIYAGQECFGRIFGNGSFVGASRNALSPFPTVVWYHYCGYRHLAHFVERFQNGICACTCQSSACRPYLGFQKSNASIPRDRVGGRTNLLRWSIQRLRLRYD